MMKSFMDCDQRASASHIEQERKTSGCRIKPKSNFNLKISV